MTPARHSPGESAAPSAVSGAVGLGVGALLTFGPLEFSEAWFPIGPLRVTTTEALALFAVALAALGLGLAWRYDRGLVERVRRRVAQPVAGLLLAFGLWAVASGLWSSTAPIDAFKAGVRLLGGVGLGLLCLGFGGEAAFRRRTIGGLAVGLAAVTALGLGERALGHELEPLLRWFRLEPTWMLGEQRLSSVFGHANTMAAYLELCLPLVLALSLRARGAYRVAATAWSLAVVTGLALTYSRAGMIAGLLCLGYCATVGRREGLRALHQRAGLLALALALSFLLNPDMRARLGFEQRSYAVSYRVDSDCVGRPDAKVGVLVHVRNDGAWPLSNRQAPGELAVVRLPRDEAPSPADFTYQPLPAIDAGEGVTLTVAVTMPVGRKSVDVVVDIRRKDVLWLSEVGVEPAQFTCLVDDGSGVFEVEPLSYMRQFNHRPIEIGRSEYWRAAGLLFLERPWVGHGADRFRQLYGRHVRSGAWDSRARAHSVIMETAANLGLVGLCLLLGVAVAVGRHFRRRRSAASLPDAAARPTRLESEAAAAARIETIALQAAVLAFAVHSLVDYFLAYTDILVVAWPILGLALSDAPPPAESPEERQWP